MDAAAMSGMADADLFSAQTARTAQTPESLTSVRSAATPKVNNPEHFNAARSTDRTQKQNVQIRKNENPAANQDRLTKTADRQTDDVKSQNVSGKTKQTTGTVTKQTRMDQSDVQNQEDPIQEAILGAEQTMIQQIMETLGVSEEEVLQGMQALDLAPADLFNPEALTNLTANLAGESDPASILTDEGLYRNLQNLISTANDLKENLAENLELSPEDLQLAMDAEVQAPDHPDNTNARVQQMPDTADAAEHTQAQNAVQDQNSAEIARNSQVKPADSDKSKVKVTAEVQIEEAEPTVEADLQAEETEDGEASGEQQDQAKQETHTQESLPKQETIPQTDIQSRTNGFEQLSDSILNRLTNPNPVNETAPAAQTEARVDMASIMEQITKAIHVQVKPDLTSMELQLHPASLGSVRALVEQNQAGEMVARFTVQNESVKQALESQLTQLRAQFDEQGIRVNEVEVSVETTPFDQGQAGSNFQQQAEQQAREAGKGSNGRTTRRIDLSELEEGEIPGQEMTDADRITAEMMAANGNTVDYTA